MMLRVAMTEHLRGIRIHTITLRCLKRAQVGALARGVRDLCPDTRTAPPRLPEQLSPDSAETGATVRQLTFNSCGEGRDVAPPSKLDSCCYVTRAFQPVCRCGCSPDSVTSTSRPTAA